MRRAAAGIGWDKMKFNHGWTQMDTDSGWMNRDTNYTNDHELGEQQHGGERGGGMRRAAGIGWDKMKFNHGWTQMDTDSGWMNRDTNCTNDHELGNGRRIGRNRNKSAPTSVGAQRR
jgi:hypothetical protein